MVQTVFLRVDPSVFTAYYGWILIYCMLALALKYNKLVTQNRAIFKILMYLDYAALKKLFKPLLNESLN